MWNKGSDSHVSLAIGIYYYIFPGLSETFFSCLGMKAVVSGPSTAKTVEKACQEPCILSLQAVALAITSVSSRVVGFPLSITIFPFTITVSISPGLIQ
jgi:hypothetical protein